jgi:hypothetical protein
MHVGLIVFFTHVWTLAISFWAENTRCEAGAQTFFQGTAEYVWQSFDVLGIGYIVEGL